MWFRRKRQTAKRLQGHDRLRSHLAGRCLKPPGQLWAARWMATTRFAR